MDDPKEDTVALLGTIDHHGFGPPGLARPWRERRLSMAWERKNLQIVDLKIQKLY